MTIDSHFGKLVDNIYDKGRLIRVGHSFNLKSQLYKIPLSINDLFNLEYEKVKELALNQTRPDGYKHSIVNGYAPIWEDRIYVPKQVTVNREVPEGSKYNANVTCVQKMWDGNKQGRRHVVLLRMINAWRRMGITKEMSHAGAMACVPTLEGTELNKLVNDVYKWNHQGYSCNDNIMVVDGNWYVSNTTLFITTIRRPATMYAKTQAPGTSARPRGLPDWSIGCFVHDF